MSDRRGGVPGFVPVLFWLPLFATVAVAWPYMLGTWLAVELGAPTPSATRSVTGWATELTMVGVGVAFWRRYRRRTLLDRRAAALAELDEALACAMSLAQRLQVAPRGTAARVPRPGSRLLCTFNEGGLVEHRSPARSADRQATVVGHGRVDISDGGIHFVGVDKIVTWKLSEIIDIQAADDYVYLPVTSRKSVSGVTVGRARHELLILALRWAEAVYAASPLDEISASVSDVVASLTAEREAAAALL